MMGLRILVNPDTPRYQLPSDLQLPPGFREEFNAWAIEFLGRSGNLIPDGRALYTSPGRGLLVNPRTFEKLKEMHG